VPPAGSITNHSVSASANIERSKQALESKLYLLPLQDWRKHDAVEAFLPTTPLTDDLGLIQGATGFGTDTISIQTEDLDSAGLTTSYARYPLWELPPEYIADESVILRAHAGMLTNQADTLATIDFEVYEGNKEAGKTGSDLVATAATTINSTSLADVDFTLTDTDLAPGDVLDVRMTVAVNDGATGAEVKAIVGWVGFVLNVRG